MDSKTTSRSAFSLYLLPVVVLNEVLKLFTPFELVALSLCSKSSKKHCKSIRSEAKCVEQTEKFHLDFSSKTEIRLRFQFHPESEWVFQFDNLPKAERKLTRMKNMVSSFFRTNTRNKRKMNYSKVMEHLYFSTFDPIQRDSTYNFFWKTFPITEYSLLIYYSENQVSAVTSWILYLSYLFNVDLDELILNIDQFKNEVNTELKHLLSWKQKNPVKGLTLTSNSSLNDEFLEQVLSLQDAEMYLKLDFNPSPQFSFDFRKFKRKLFLLEITHSHWVHSEQLYELNVRYLTLKRSTLSSVDMKSIVQCWKMVGRLSGSS
ncbi:hypothetical protein CRE_07916 [Caenorhabditis remanei]|uniref:F-box domain-containing protein n=1 Tax=Caenorhabditis remanei TaxID=31234 RepID=E3NPK1_CAERE|nr:hypothetical protein CRE_07916 [Caenorhabditis remanei]